MRFNLLRALNPLLPVDLIADVTESAVTIVSQNVADVVLGALKPTVQSVTMPLIGSTAYVGFAVCSKTTGLGECVFRGVTGGVSWIREEDNTDFLLLNCYNNIKLNAKT